MFTRFVQTAAKEGFNKFVNGGNVQAGAKALAAAGATAGAADIVKSTIEKGINSSFVQKAIEGQKRGSGNNGPIL